LRVADSTRRESDSVNAGFLRDPEAGVVNFAVMRLTNSLVKPPPETLANFLKDCSPARGVRTELLKREYVHASYDRREANGPEAFQP